MNLDEAIAVYLYLGSSNVIRGRRSPSQQDAFVQAGLIIEREAEKVLGWLPPMKGKKECP